MDLETFKKNWIGKTVVVTDRTHPHFGQLSEVIEVEKTFAGMGMKLRNDDNSSVFYGEEFYVFRGNQIKVI